MPGWWPLAVPASCAEDLLVVLLGRSFSAKDNVALVKDAVARTCQEIQSKIQPRYLIVTDVEKGQFGVEGTVADLHSIAKQAKHRRWTSLICFDDKSLRFLLGLTELGEYDDLTVNKIYLKRQSKEDEHLSESTFFLRRLALSVALTDAEHRSHISWSQSTWGCRTLNDSVTFLACFIPNPSRFYDSGVYLRDPYRTPFRRDESREDTDKLAIEALNSVQPSLPPEIIQHIYGLVLDPLPLDMLTDAPRGFVDTSSEIRIQVLFPMQARQFSKLKDDLQRAIGLLRPELTLSLYPWKSSAPGNRRDICRLFLRHLDDGNLGPYVFLADLPPKPCDSGLPGVQAPRLSWCEIQSACPWLLVNTSFSDCLNHYCSRRRETTIHFYALSEGPREIPDVKTTDRVYSTQGGSRIERLIRPDSSFPPALPRWIRPKDVEISCGAGLPAFYVTNKFSDRDMKRIARMLYQNRRRNTFTLVTWEEDKDGDEHDMWKLFKQMAIFHGGREQPQQCIFIDKESLNAQTVIVADSIYFSRINQLGGMRYRRVPICAAQNYMADLLIGGIALAHWDDALGDDSNKTQIYISPEVDVGVDIEAELQYENEKLLWEMHREDDSDDNDEWWDQGGNEDEDDSGSNLDAPIPEYMLERILGPKRTNDTGNGEGEEVGSEAEKT